MNETAIRVGDLSKQYRIGAPQPGDRTLRESAIDKLAIPPRRLRSFAQRLSLGGNGRAADSGEHIWALRNLSFEIKRGEVVGIIGSNGAGKSTLLKILSRITKPTEGYARINGRVGSLLEVGTGFHPELTGRENIYLSGAILGMKKAEMVRKFDEIVDFSGVEKFIDTPVKRYSSGMQVRLGFAVAAHLEPEILLVDEVLAVGDAAFQKRCLGKMSNVASEGRTVLFVSHNMNAVKRLCPQSILLEGGRLVASDDSSNIIARYLTWTPNISKPTEWIDLSEVGRTGEGKAYFQGVWYSSDSKAAHLMPYSDGPLEFRLAIMSDSPREIGSIAITFYDQYGSKLVNADSISIGQGMSLRKGRNVVRLRIDALHLNPGVYVLGLWLATPPSQVFDYVESAIRVEVVNLKYEGLGVRPTADGSVTCVFDILDAN